MTDDHLRSPRQQGRGLRPSPVIVDDLPGVWVHRRSHLARVERVRESLRTAEHPLVALRWALMVERPEVVAEACADEQVRARLREPFAQLAEVFARFGEAIAPAVEAARQAMLGLHRSMREAGALPDEGPSDPRARALWLRQRRGTGPDRQVQHRPRPRRL